MCVEGLGGGTREIHRGAVTEEEEAEVGEQEAGGSREVNGGVGVHQEALALDRSNRLSQLGNHHREVTEKPFHPPEIGDEMTLQFPRSMELMGLHGGSHLCAE